MSRFLGVIFLIVTFAVGIAMLSSNYEHGDTLIPAIMVTGLPLLIVLVRFGNNIYSGNQRAILYFIAAVVTGLLLAGIYTIVSTTVVVTRPPAEVIQAFARSCSGQAISDAGDYGDGMAQPFHLVLLNESGEPHKWTGYPPLDWRPASIADTELVACVEPEQKQTLIQTCQYSGGSSVKRYKTSLNVKVVKAKTGSVIGSFEESHAPRQCGQTEKREVTKLTGDDVTFNEIEVRLHDYVQVAATSVITPQAKNTDAIAGTWSGTAKKGDSTYHITLTIKKSCKIGSECVMITTSDPCSGTSTLLSVSDTYYHMQTRILTGSCADDTTDVLQLLPNGTLLYNSQHASFGMSEGILNKISK